MSQSDQITQLIDAIRPLMSGAADRPPSPHHDDQSMVMLAAENALLQFALEALPVGLSMFDADDRLLLWNSRFFEIWPHPEALRVRGTHFSDLMESLQLREIEHPSSPAKPLGTPGRRRREFMLNESRRIEVHVDSLPDGSSVAVHEDVTEKRADERRIHFLATHDSLTKLPDRTTLRAELMRMANDDRAPQAAVLYLDLDRFKAINDSLGHAAGDRLLVAVAERLTRCTRPDDLVARIGGDEFVIVQGNTEQPESALQLGKRVVEALTQPFSLNAHQVTIGVSVGIAIATHPLSEPDHLLNSADRALYQAKSQGGNAVCLADKAPLLKAS